MESSNKRWCSPAIIFFQTYTPLIAKVKPFKNNEKSDKLQRLDFDIPQKGLLFYG